MPQAIIAVALLASASWADEDRRPLPKSTCRPFWTDGAKRGWYVQYAYDTSGNLAYAVFQTGLPEGQALLVEPGTSYSFQAGLHTATSMDRLWKPDGKMIHLPSKVQLYEYINGEFRESPARVSKDHFEAFLESEQKEYTVKALLQFVKERQKKLGPDKPTTKK